MLNEGFYRGSVRYKNYMVTDAKGHVLRASAVMDPRYKPRAGLTPASFKSHTKVPDEAADIDSQSIAAQHASIRESELAAARRRRRLIAAVHKRKTLVEWLHGLGIQPNTPPPLLEHAGELVGTTAVTGSKKAHLCDEWHNGVLLSQLAAAVCTGNRQHIKEDSIGKGKKRLVCIGTQTRVTSRAQVLENSGIGLKLLRSLPAMHILARHVSRDQKSYFDQPLAPSSRSRSRSRSPSGAAVSSSAESEHDSLEHPGRRTGRFGGKGVSFSLGPDRPGGVSLRCRGREVAAGLYASPNEIESGQVSVWCIITTVFLAVRGWEASKTGGAEILTMTKGNRTRKVHFGTTPTQHRSRDSRGLDPTPYLEEVDALVSPTKKKLNKDGVQLQPGSVDRRRSRSPGRWSGSRSGAPGTPHTPDSLGGGDLMPEWDARSVTPQSSSASARERNNSRSPTPRRADRGHTGARAGAVKPEPLMPAPMSAVDEEALRGLGLRVFA